MHLFFYLKSQSLTFDKVIHDDISAYLARSQHKTSVTHRSLWKYQSIIVSTVVIT